MHKNVQKTSEEKREKTKEKTCEKRKKMCEKTCKKRAKKRVKKSAKNVRKNVRKTREEKREKTCKKTRKEMWKKRILYRQNASTFTGKLSDLEQIMNLKRHLPSIFRGNCRFSGVSTSELLQESGSFAVAENAMCIESQLGAE